MQVRVQQIEKMGEIGKGAFGGAHLYRVIDANLLTNLKNLGLCDDDGLIVIKTLSKPSLVLNTALNAEGVAAEKLRNASLDQGLSRSVINLATGARLDNGRSIIISRYEKKGNALNYFDALAKLPHDEAVVIDRGILLANMFSDLMRSMKFMHETGMLHLDIAARNILIDEQGRAKLGDFGFSKEIGNNKKIHFEKFEGAILYKDIEALSHEQVSRVSDLISLKIAMLEMIAVAAGMGIPPDILPKRGKIIQLTESKEPDFELHFKSIRDKVENYLLSHADDIRCIQVKSLFDTFKPFLSVQLGKSQTTFDDPDAEIKKGEKQFNHASDVYSFTRKNEFIKNVLAIAKNKAYWNNQSDPSLLNTMDKIVAIIAMLKNPQEKTLSATINKLKALVATAETTNPNAQALFAMINAQDVTKNLPGIQAMALELKQQPKLAINLVKNILNNEEFWKQHKGWKVLPKGLNELKQLVNNYSEKDLDKMLPAHMAMLMDQVKKIADERVSFDSTEQSLFHAISTSPNLEGLVGHLEFIDMQIRSGNHDINTLSVTIDPTLTFSNADPEFETSSETSETEESYDPSEAYGVLPETDDEVDSPKNSTPADNSTVNMLRVLGIGIAPSVENKPANSFTEVISTLNEILKHLDLPPQRDFTEQMLAVINITHDESVGQKILEVANNYLQKDKSDSFVADICIILSKQDDNMQKDLQAALSSLKGGYGGIPNKNSDVDPQAPNDREKFRPT